MVDKILTRQNHGENANASYFPHLTFENKLIKISINDIKFDLLYFVPLTFFNF